MTLPNRWKWSTIENCVEILDNRRIPVNREEREKRILGKDQSKLFPYYGATGLVGFIDDYIFDEEIILLGEDGAPFLDASKDKAYIVRGKSWVNNHAHVLKAKDGITNNAFIMHYLNTFDYRDYVTGTTRLKLNQSRMRDFPMLVPPLPEQERIVARIEELFTRLDAGVTGLKRVQAALKRYKASVLKAACEGRLTTEIRNDPSVGARRDAPLPMDRDAPLPMDRDAPLPSNRDVALQNAPQQIVPHYDASQQPHRTLTDDNLPELPEGWQWVKIYDLANVGTGATPLRSKIKYWENGNIPWVTSSALNNLYINQAEEYITEIALKETNAKIFPAGTLLIALYGEGKTRGKVSELMINAASNQACAALIFDNSALYRPFIKIFFQNNYEDIRRLSSGGVQPNLNLTIIRNTLVPLPPLDEQRIIVAEVERRLSVAAQLEAAVETGLKRAARLRQSILKRAFEGRL